MLLPLLIIASGVSAFLLLWVQPLVAKDLLPKLGGSPMVWNTAMVFFQACLLAGYGLAHWLQQAAAPTQRLAQSGGLLLLA